jgi:hypothetical protein
MADDPDIVLQNLRAFIIGIVMTMVIMLLFDYL